jgi:hypothetical protein
MRDLAKAARQAEQAVSDAAHWLDAASGQGSENVEAGARALRDDKPGRALALVLPRVTPGGCST